MKSYYILLLAFCIMSIAYAQHKNHPIPKLGRETIKNASVCGIAFTVIGAATGGHFSQAPLFLMLAANVIVVIDETFGL
jgi:hypothetical protein